MGILNRFNMAIRYILNANPSLMTDEAIEQPRASAYCDPLIYHQHDNFGNIIDRRMNLYLDPLINMLTFGWARLATAKTFKFYSSHGADGEEIMQDFRMWWKAMGLDEVLKASIPHMCMDGHLLLELGFTPDGRLEYESYGSYECAPTHWYRNGENDILWYNVKFTPMPRPFTWNYGGAQLQGVSKEYLPGEVEHLTRGDWNYGLGQSRILPVWDSAVKLRTGSHADMFRRDIRFMVAIPEAWKKGKTDNFMKTLNDFIRSRRRAFIYRMEQAKTPEMTPLELPRMGFQSLADQAPKPLSQSEAGGALLRDPEWARFLAGCGHTENYFIGNQAGAVTGSEVDLTRDFYTECEEFSLSAEPIIRKIIGWFVERGLLPEPPEEYVIKYWKDWEHVEMAQQLQEAEMEQEQEQIGDQEAKQNELEFKINNAVHEILIEAFKTNANVPMTTVMSSWVEKVGAYKGHLLIKYKSSDTIFGYSYPGEDQEKYTEMTDATSKGGWVWDNILRRPSIYGMEQGAPFQKGSKYIHQNPPGRPAAFEYNPVGDFGTLGLGEAEESRQFKMEGDPETLTEGLGTSTAPFPAKAPPSASGYTSTGATMLDPMATTGHQDVHTWGYAHEPSSITGSKRIGPGRKRSPGKSKTRSPIVPVNLTKPVKVGNRRQVFNSASALMRMAKNEMDWGMSKTTAYNIMELVNTLRKNAYRVNSLAIGNGIKADHPMFYDVGGTISKEYICPDSYKENVGKTVPLGIYHNKEEDAPELPDWQVIGTYTIQGWDEENGKDIAIIDYDETKINAVFERLNEPNWIAPLLAQGRLPDVSTAYYCDVVWRDNKNIQTNIDIKSVSFVPAGNCPGNVCAFTPKEVNA